MIFSMLMLSVENSCGFDKFRGSFTRVARREIYFVEKAPLTGCLLFLLLKRVYDGCVERTNVVEM